MGTEWDFPLGQGLDSRLTRLVDYQREEGLGEDLDSHLTHLMGHHPEADLGQGQGHQGHCHRRSDHQGHRRRRPDHQGCYVLITCHEA